MYFGNNNLSELKQNRDKNKRDNQSFDKVSH